MNLNLTFISAPGTIVHYDCVYYVYVYYSMSCIFAFDLFYKTTQTCHTMNTVDVVHAGRCKPHSQASVPYYFHL